MIGLIDRADVYTATDSGYTVLDETGVPCRLLTIPALQPEGAGREEQVMRKRLLLGPDTVLPGDCQVEIASERWNVVPHTSEGARGPAGTVLYRRCDVVRALA